ncbi:otopetrin-2 [Lingula anatina]|uniref:Otopetrin-2 n=1 Tax=Lingula anatina TaxID=7574 RepID=A0A1S3JHW7_LINAN|nr:otopetrin-2 [Lingula anatina]|eukprot:XP_013410010.1 otopetrin-2 [Lingula anatina]
MANRKSKGNSWSHQLCSLYSLLVLSLGLALPLVAAFQNGPASQSVIYTKVFELYLYTTAILYLLYLHWYLIRVHDPKRKQHGAVAIQKLRPGGENGLTDSAETDNQGATTLPVHLGGRGISVYLRYGVILFSIGTIIYIGFHLTEFALEIVGRCKDVSALTVTVGVVHLLFTFIQTFFVFKYHTIVVNKHLVFARFGFIHLMITNLCIWLLYVIVESSDDFFDDSKTTNSSGTATNHNDDTLGCTAIMSITERASPYLYPCVLEYNIIAAAVMYTIYNTVGTLPNISEKKPHKPSIHETMDGVSKGCDKSNVGLFLGMLVAIITLISLSIYFVLFAEAGRDGYQWLYLIPFESMMIFVLMASLIAVIVSVWKMRILDYRQEQDGGVSVFLMLTGTLGGYIGNIFVGIALLHVVYTMDTTLILTLISTFLSVIQITIQTFCIFDGGRRQVADTNHVIQKPGRSALALLLICNLCLWVIETLAVKKAFEHTTVFEDLYGNLPWKIITHATIPLIIFYRFHSAAELSGIWSRAYVPKVIEQVEVTKL